MAGEQGGPVWVIGAGGHGKSVISVLRVSGYTVEGLVDDDSSLWGTEVLEVPVVGPVDELAGRQNARAVIAIADNVARKQIAERLDHVEWVTLVYPNNYLNPLARLGPGAVVFPGAVIGVDVSIGAHAIISGQCTVGHDTVLEDYVQLGPGAIVAGEAFVGEGTFLAMGSMVAQRVRVGGWSILGAGAAALRDLPAGCKAFGIPARPVGELSKKDDSAR
ncbi:MAG TPA: acetyltransferase [Ardenticatenaceae bacterium]|jgi:sugar O-acyltransferase (sialic acid O-acetyltransferase NeuD family)